MHAYCSGEVNWPTLDPHNGEDKIRLAIPVCADPAQYIEVGLGKTTKLLQ